MQVIAQHNGLPLRSESWVHPPFSLFPPSITDASSFSNRNAAVHSIFYGRRRCWAPQVAGWSLGWHPTQLSTWDRQDSKEHRTRSSKKGSSFEPRVVTSLNRLSFECGCFLSLWSMLSTCHAGKASELGLALSIHKIHRFLGLSLVKDTHQVYFPQRRSSARIYNSETGDERPIECRRLQNVNAAISVR